MRLFSDSKPRDFEKFQLFTVFRFDNAKEMKEDARTVAYYWIGD